ncbi:MAG: cyclic nucleotide-binding domain-containing protein [Polyangiales bacterium]
MITVPTLRALPSLQRFTEPELGVLLTVATPRRLAAGTVLFKEGDAGLSCLLLAEGDLQVFKIIAGRQQPVALLKPGALVGQLALVDRAPRSATVRAGTDAWVLEFTRDDFDRLLRAQSPLALRFQEQIAIAGARQLRTSTERLAKIIEATAASPALVPVDAITTMRMSLDDWGLAVETDSH